jgi:hypothetical protein
MTWRDVYARQGHLDVLDDHDPRLDETTLMVLDDTDDEYVYLYMESVLRACHVALKDGVDRVVCVEPGRHDISVRDALASLRLWLIQHSGVYSKDVADDMRWITCHIWAALGQQDDRLVHACRDMLAFLYPLQ